ncbi:MAG: hypothetical protein QM619_02130 [Micropruina sp.]|uniref:hypothetical protein n=1 Tax=Micropruina sp. TaxID=2737536 RepID=UPI0039E59299
MHEAASQLPSNKQALEELAMRQAREIELSARLETVERIRVRGQRVLAEFSRLYRDAVAELGPDHAISLGAEKGLILEQRNKDGSALTARRLADLASRCSAVLGEDEPITRAASAEAVRFSRYAGNTMWRQDYERLIVEAEVRYGVDSRLASIKRSNLSVALNEWGQSEADREEAYRIAVREWQWRLDTYGPDSPFPYVAAANALSAALRALQYGKPLMDNRKLQDQALNVYEQRLRLLGREHEQTQNLFVTLHSVRSELGHNDARWQLLSVVGNEHEGRVTTGMPESLPLALSRAFALAGDLESAKTWMDTVREILERNHGADAPRTTGAIAFLERSILAVN